MKTILFVLMAVLATASTFAQKAKSKIPAAKTTIAIQSKYVCPMHPQVTSDIPGKCHECKMDLTLSKKEQMKMNATKTYTCPMHADVVSGTSGKCPKCNSSLVLPVKEQMKTSVMKYTCPMHSNEISDNPGKCPACGMELTKGKTKSRG